MLSHRGKRRDEGEESESGAKETSQERLEFADNEMKEKKQRKREKGIIRASSFSAFNWINLRQSGGKNG